MLRRLVTWLLVCSLAAGCASPPPQHAMRYCSVISFEPCLVQERTGNCQPCPGQN